MSYDDWRLATPDSYENEDGNTCLYCGEGIDSSKSYCDMNCKTADCNE